MGRSTRDEWARRVERWQDSGLTAAAFGEEIGVNPRTLSYWKWRLGKEGQRLQRPRAKVTETVSFLELTNVVEASPHVGGGLELAIGRYVIRVGPATDSETLERVLDVLERRA